MKITKIAKKSSMEILKENKISLTEEERNEVMKAKAVWHHGPNGEETPAVWKSKNSKGETVYVTNTHRAYQTASTLKGAINKYHNGIKQTASSEKMIRSAYTADQNRKKIDRNEKDIKDIKRDLKSIDREVKKVVKAIESLNIGQRRYWQEKTSFTSIQRKIERFEKLEGEWNKYKKEMDSKLKRLIQQKPRAGI